MKINKGQVRRLYNVLFVPIYAILVICLPEFFQDPPEHFSQDIIEGMYSSEVAEWKSSRINQEIEINDLYRDIGWDKRLLIGNSI